jgi:hypothetical protein
MERYDWNTFSLIIDPRLPGEEELIDEFEEHGNEQQNWYFIQFYVSLILRIYFSKKTSYNRMHLKGQKK